MKNGLFYLLATCVVVVAMDLLYVFLGTTRKERIVAYRWTHLILIKEQWVWNGVHSAS
jgi:hypothetical protein